ncbi:glycosyltransferase family 2 protein [Empedobacter falsenii]
MNKLAIVIPYYKIDFFEETLKSVADQIDKRFTLYIGNDASPNNPLPLIQKYFPDGNYHYFNYQENLGGNNLASQWERILENVTEDWFQILGDDDMVLANFVEEFYEKITLIESKNIYVIKVSQAFINKKSEKTTTYSKYDEVITTNDFWNFKFNLGHRSSLSEHIFNKEIYEKYKFEKYPLAWHSDDMAVIKFSIPNGIYYLDKTKVYVRFSEKSISGQVNDKNNNDLKNIATYQFYADMLNHYIKYLGKKEARVTLEKHFYRMWNLKFRNNLNLISIYIYLNEYRKIITIPYKNYQFNNNAKKN